MRQEEGGGAETEAEANGGQRGGNGAEVQDGSPKSFGVVNGIVTRTLTPAAPPPPEPSFSSMEVLPVTASCVCRETEAQGLFKDTRLQDSVMPRRKKALAYKSATSGNVVDRHMAFHGCFWA